MKKTKPAVESSLVLMPAPAKRRATKSDLVQMIAELEYKRREAEAAKTNEAFEKKREAFYAETLKVFTKTLKCLDPSAFKTHSSPYGEGVNFTFFVRDTPRMKTLRKAWQEAPLGFAPTFETVLKEVRAKMERHRIDHIKLALAEDPALRQGVEELRKQLFN